MKKCILIAVSVLTLNAPTIAQTVAQKYEFINFSKVNITDNFWKPKMDKVATTTLNTCIYQTEIKTPRIRNFEKVARKKGEKHEGIYYDDSDVYKALEAMGYSLKNKPNPELEKKADEWIEKISAAQLPDGYLNTYYTLTDLSKRWTDVEKHEDYCAGHLMEAAVAYYDATGKKKLLDVAIRFANHIDSTFRLANKPWFSGHQEIELALVKLYKSTGNNNYLKLADWYLQQRGHGYYDYSKSRFIPDYWQEGLPVKEQKEITGHAVRAMYLYTGAADVGGLIGDEGYLKAMKNVWDDVVYRNMYITGGIGSAGHNEGFTQDYDLPNEEAYCETCASVGMVFWNQRMAEYSGESKYMDVLEKSLYNAALDGLSLTGDRFFYDNPLFSSGQHERKEWFGTACCPSNIARLISSLGGYIYGKSEDGFWVNLFVNSSTDVDFKNNHTSIRTETNYPWNGEIKIRVDPDVKQQFKLRLRIPGYANGQAAPGDLYFYKDYVKPLVTIKVNGKAQQAKEENGYLIIDREWQKNDLVEYNIPMNVLKVVAKNDVKYNRDKMALQRGPFIYCIEGADNNGEVRDLVIPSNSRFTPVNYMVSTEKIIAIQADGEQAAPDPTGKKIIVNEKKITAIPYYTWANRGANSMQVWLPLKIKTVKINTEK